MYFFAEKGHNLSILVCLRQSLLLSFFLQTDAAHSWTCMDLYVFATPYRIMWDYYFSAREHTLEIKSWEEPAELEYVSSTYCVSFYLDIFH